MSRNQICINTQVCTMSHACVTTKIQLYTRSLKAPTKYTYEFELFAERWTRLTFGLTDLVQFPSQSNLQAASVPPSVQHCTYFELVLLLPNRIELISVLCKRFWLHKSKTRLVKLFFFVAVAVFT